MQNYAKISVAFLLIFLLTAPLYALGDSPFHFNQVAPKNSEINGNFDIIYFGGTPSGEYVEFWIQVRGEIDMSPQEGYMNAYIINIYGNETYGFGIVWWNLNGTINQKAWFTKGNNTRPLDINEYAVNGNKIIFYIPVAELSDVDDEYHLTVTTIHMDYSSNSITTDSADYIYKPYKYPEESGGYPSYLVPLLGITLIIVIIALIFSALKRRG